jgi:beta-glucosidase
MTAVERGLITEAEIDVAVTRLFDIRFKLGMFDPPEMVPYAQIPYEVSDCEEHHQLSLNMARESIVLLKNARTNDKDASPLLPLSKDLKSIAVIGPNADSKEVAVANYFGTPSKWVSALAGIRAAVSPDTKVYYSEGCDIIGNTGEWNGGSKQFFTESLSAAERAEAVIMCLGISARLEGEEGDAFNSDASGDRIRIDLPEIQMELMKAVCALGKPVVLVLFNGSALAVNWASENVPAIIEAWYPGAEGGTAIADVIFGNYNPAGRLPVTFYK